jgi:hypothetical protein
VNLKCLWYGAVGTDDEPYPSHLDRGLPRRESQERYAFEVRGNYRGRPVRKCLQCGNGVRMTFLPPRFRKVPATQWVELQRMWEDYLEQEAIEGVVAATKSWRGEDAE